MYNERQLDRATARAGYQETPGQFRRTFANLRYDNPALYEQKRAEQRAARATYMAQRPPARAASSLAARLAQRKMQQPMGYNPVSGVPSFGM